MKGLGLGLLIWIISLWYLDGFTTTTTYLQKRHNNNKNLAQGSIISKLLVENDDNNHNQLLEHEDIIWKIRPPKDQTTVWQRLWLRIAANIIRIDCWMKRQEPPLVLCPKGVKYTILEAHTRKKKKKKMTTTQIGRFGFTTIAGPSNPQIQETIHDLYGLDINRQYRAGAIIFMFVEEEYRKKNVGTLALQVISLIQNIQACDFTMLVADDDGSGKLVQWYQQQQQHGGFQLAPKLQEMLGSPNKIHGVAMMAPTNRTLPENCTIQWW